MVTTPVEIDAPGQLDPEVPERARMRRYSPVYKLRILQEYETLDKSGKGALLRREGLYSSLITEWRRQRDRGAAAGLAQRPGRPEADPRDRELARLQKRMARLELELDKARKVIEIQSKLSALLEGLAAESAAPASEPALMVDSAATELAPLVGTKGACQAVGRARATYYRHSRPTAPEPPGIRRRSPRALVPAEVSEVLEVLHSERFIDMAPAEIYATLLDEGQYLASVPTMYRILRSLGEVHERRRQATHPARVKPELVAERPNQVWSWDITKLHGPAKWTYYYLYVIIDIYSRQVVGWMVASRESSALAERLLAETIRRHGVDPDQLTIHADNGSSMASKPVALLLADLGITKSHSRPHVSNDNPYSESQFKTLKYRPDFPRQFGSLEDARSFCQQFFAWYNGVHRHSGIGFHTPADVHYGRALGRRTFRARVLDTAYAAHPDRFVRKPPEPPRLPGAASINRPTQEVA